MDFDIKKPVHIFSLLLIEITFLFVIILPIITFFFASGTVESIDQYSDIPSSYRLIFEIFVLFFSLAFAVVLLIFFPLIWYFLVNNYNFKKTLSRLRLTFDKIYMALFWGIITAIVIFGITIVIGNIVISIFETNSQEMSNVPDLEALFSPVSLFLLVAIQPIAEEFFFRGFLLDKFESLAGQNIAIISTAVLFGLAHASYGKLYPIVLPIIMGIVLAYVVIKTKNLYTAIIAHVCFNVGVLILTFLARSFVT